MSWDVFIMRFPDDLASPSEIPNDWSPPPLGTNAEVRSRIRGVLPDVEIRTDGFTDYQGPGFVLEMDLTGEDDEETDGVTLLFHGGGGAAAGLAVAITEALGARAIETGLGGFLAAETAGESWGAWQRYRDHVIEQVGRSGTH